MAITELQRQARGKGIGASECAAILGMDPYRSAYDVWMEKTAKVDPDADQSEASEIGNEIEPTTARLAEKRLGVRLVKPTATYKADNGVMFANLDRQCVKAIRGAEVVELKSTGIAEGWGDEGTDQVPDRVLVQVHAQMVCAGSSVAHVARILGRFGFSFGMFYVPKNPSLAGMIEDRVCGFWRNHVEKDIPPADSVPSLDVVSRVRRTAGKVVAVDRELVSRYSTARYERLTAEKVEDAARANLLAAMGDADGAECDGFRVSYTEITTKPKLVQSMVEEKYPEVFAVCCAPSSYRKLTVKETK